MHKGLRLVGTFIGALSLGAVAPNLAAAATLSGQAGGPATPADAGSFQYGFSGHAGAWGLGLRNLSSETKGWIYTPSIEPGRAYNFTVRASELGTEEAFAYCYAISVDAEGMSVRGGNSAATTDTTGWQTLRFTSAPVPEGGTLYVVCMIAGNSSAKVLSLAWD